MDELRNKVAGEKSTLARLKTELDENRRALQGLQEEVPERVVSVTRLSQLRLAMKHQQAATDAQLKELAEGMRAIQTALGLRVKAPVLPSVAEAEEGEAAPSSRRGWLPFGDHSIFSQGHSNRQQMQSNRVYTTSVGQDDLHA